MTVVTTILTRFGTLSAIKPVEWAIICSIALAAFSDALDGFALYGFPLRRVFHLSFLFISIGAMFYWRNEILLRLQGNASALDNSHRLAALLFIYAVIVTAGQIYLLWDKITAERLFFVSVRIFHLGLIAFVFWFSFRIARAMEPYFARIIIDLLIAVGVVVALVAICDYVATRFGYVLFVRNAEGTGYSEIPIKFFYYGYHRAMGSFREPSHLGAYLIPLYFMALSRARLIAAVTICAAAIISLSLIVYLSLFLTVMVVTVWLLLCGGRQKFWLINIGVSWVASTLLAWGLVYSYDATTVGYLQSRLDLVSQSRAVIPGRDYVFYYFLSRPLELFGQGLGFSSFDIGDFLGSPRPASFLSVIFYLYASLGVFGLVLAIAFFLSLITGLGSMARHENSSIFWKGLLSAVIGVGLVWCFLIEEPSVQGMLILGLATGLIYHSRQLGLGNA